MYTWHTLKLFLSSTFKDLELQRDHLAKVLNRIKDIFYFLSIKRRIIKDIFKNCLPI